MHERLFQQDTKSNVFGALFLEGCRLARGVNPFSPPNSHVDHCPGQAGVPSFSGIVQSCDD